MKLEDKERDGVISLERFIGTRRPNTVRRVSPILVVFWTVLWLVGAMHCSLEALGVLTDDHCCVVPISSTEQAGHASQSGCSYEESARPLSPHAEDFVPTPGPMIDLAVSVAIPPRSVLTFIPSLSDDTPSGLSQRWQFRWRTALSPRAPSFLA